MAKRILKVVVGTVVIIMLLLLSIGIALQFPAVQNLVVHQVTKSLSKSLGTPLQISSIRIRFIRSLRIDSIFVADQQQDTLLYADRIQAKLGLFSLLRKKINLDQIEIRGLRSNIYRPASGPDFSFQFLVDHFAGDTTATSSPPKDTSTAWEIRYGDLLLNDAHFNWQDSLNQFYLQTQLGALTLRGRKIDLAGQNIYLRQLKLEKGKVNVQLSPVVDTTNTPDQPLVFPYPGWDLALDQLSIEDTDVRYWLDNVPVQEKGMDYSHLDLKNIQLAVRDFSWDSSQLKLQLRKLQASDRCGLVVQNGTGNFQLTPKQISVEELDLQTSGSRIRNATLLEFQSWASLPDFLQQVHYQTTFNETTIAFKDLAYFVPDLPAEYSSVTVPVQIKTRLDGQEGKLQILGLQLNAGTLGALQLNGRLDSLDQPDGLSYYLNIQRLTSKTATLRRNLPGLQLPQGLEGLGTVQLATRLEGNLKDLLADQIQLTTTDQSFFKGGARLKDFTQPEKMSFDLAIDSLSVHPKSIAYFVENDLPAELYRLGQLQYKGRVQGTLKMYNLNGALQTSLGQLQPNAAIQFSEDYQDASYDGRLELLDFDLGQFLADTAIGKLSLNISAEGKGLSLETIDARLKGKITQFEYNKYQYQDLTIDGQMAQQRFTGHAGISDPNIDLQFNGTADWQAQPARFAFGMQVDTINFAQLGLLSSALHLKTRVDADFTGNTIDDFKGDLGIYELDLSNDTLHYQTDAMVLRSSGETGNFKRLQFRSDILQAKLEGDFEIVKLPRILINFVNDYFPVDQVLLEADRPDSLALEPVPEPPFPAQSFTMELEWRHPEKLTKVFSPALQQLEYGRLSGKLNTQERDLAMDLEIPKVILQDLTIDSISGTITGDPRQLKAKLDLARLISGNNQFSKNTVEFQLLNQRMEANWYIGNESGDNLMRWGIGATAVDSSYEFHLADSLQLADQLWRISPDHFIILGPNQYWLDNVQLMNGKQAISLQSKAVTYNEPLQVSFQGVQLEPISDLLNFPMLRIAGKLEGTMEAGKLMTALNWKTDLRIDQFILNDSLLGNLVLQAAMADPQAPVMVDSRLQGRTNQLALKGSYDIQQAKLGLNLEVDPINLALLNPFLEGTAEEIKGLVKANMTIEGSIDQPELSGTLQVSGAAARVMLLKEKYQMPNASIRFSPHRIDLGTITMIDRAGRQAQLTGYVLHDHLKDFRFQLDMEADRFRALNTNPGDNSLYYGQLIISMNTQIRGTLEKPQINVRASTQSGSKLTVITPGTTESLEQESYIIFGRPDEQPLDSILVQRQERKLPEPKLDLVLNLRVDPKTELIVIIDPVTGDQLECKGTGNLTVEMHPDESIEILGQYTLASGYYQLNYQGLVNRRFELQPGGQLNFIGDPLDTRFNLSAAYTARTSVFELIANEAILSETETRQAKLRRPVRTLMEMQGDLSRLDLSFDIEIPGIASTGIGSIVNRKLQQLREDEAELNKQVFGLLLLNSFIAEQSGTASLTTAGENVALASVSNLISNQLNRLADQYAQGFGIQFDLESYRAQLGNYDATSTVTNLNVGLNKTLFNDRLRVQVGGVLQLNDQQDGTVNSAIAGDFVLEYQLTPNGNYVLRVFRRNDFDLFQNGNVPKTGAGISVKRSFK